MLVLLARSKCYRLAKNVFSEVKLKLVKECFLFSNLSLYTISELHQLTDVHMHADPLVLRMVEGLGSNKYKPVDYTRLKALASEKKFASLKTSMKVNKIEKISRANKESSILKQHQLVWQKEFLRLQHLRRKVSTSVGPACGS